MSAARAGILLEINYCTPGTGTTNLELEELFSTASNRSEDRRRGCLLVCFPDFSGCSSFIVGEMCNSRCIRFALLFALLLFEAK